MKKTNILTILTCALAALNYGCASDLPRMPKYNSHASYKPDTAIIIVNTRNVSYIDLNKYYPDSFERDNAFYNKKEDKPVAMQPVTMNPVPNSTYEHNSEFKDGFDLRRLFGKKSTKSTELQPIAEIAAPAESTVKTVATTAQHSNTWRLFKPTLSIATPFNYSKAVYTVEPGVYYIAFAFQETSTLPNLTREPGVTKQGEIMYGAFEVKAGTVLYLGDIDFNWITRNQQKRVTIVNNINAVYKDLRAHGYDNLAEKLEVANFYPRGTNVSCITTE